MPEPPSPLVFPLPPAHEISMARLEHALNIANTRWWGHPPVTKKCVMDRWRAGDFDCTSYTTYPDGWTRERHLSRVAFFCAHGWRQPAVLTIQSHQVRALDGIHRLLAAWTLNHRVITARVVGGSQTKQQILGVQARTSQLFFPSPMVLGKGRPMTDQTGELTSNMTSPAP